MISCNCILMCIVSLSMIGCGSPKSASKENFQRALNSYHSKSCMLVSLSPSFNRFPVTKKLRTVVKKGNLTTVYSEGEDTTKYDALVSIGFLYVKNGKQQVSSFFTRGNGNVDIKTKIYSISEKGQQYFRSIGGSLITKSGFCAGTYKVDVVRSFTEPSQGIMGVTMSIVNYKVSPFNVRKWAEEEEIIKAFPELKDMLVKNVDMKANMILMDDGWHHQEGSL